MSYFKNLQVNLPYFELNTQHHPSQSCTLNENSNNHPTFRFHLIRNKDDAEMFWLILNFPNLKKQLTDDYHRVPTRISLDVKCR